MKKQIGFTLVELMITLAVAAVLITIAVPSFRDYTLNARLTTVTNELVAAASLARSEAIKRGRPATLCVSNNSMSVNPTCTGGTDWTLGWLVWVDDNNDGVLQNGEEIRVFDSFASTNLIMTSDGASAFTYDSTGAVDVQPVITVCDTRPNETGRQITVSATGRVETDRAFPGC